MEVNVRVTIVKEKLLAPNAQALIKSLNAELAEQYPEPGATHFALTEEEVGEGRGVFLVASVDGRPVGCGALRRIEAGVGELKRMYVSPAVRGRGVGRALLEALEAEARRLGLRRVVLETGVRQREALALYGRAGFTPIPPFGECVGSPLSLCMAKDL
ncbi:MAG TPA: GNAT family N-acetyltransferase [Vicinamibacteria bacterium]|nr:GNAT family N-acetyltransferase [Vicinamibacteria bacterium]